MSSNRTLYGTISATAPYGDTVTQLDVNLTPTQSGTPWKDDTVNNAPYVFRSVPMGNREWNKLVGGSVVWNQLEELLYPTGTVASLTVTNNNDGSMTINGTATSAGTVQLSRNPRQIKTGHVYYFESLASLPTGARLTLSGINLSGQNNGIYKRTGASTNLYLRIDFANGTVFDNLKVWPMIIDLTAYLRAPIADYVHSLEKATAGSGIAWLKNYDLIDDAYHAYSAPTLQSVEATSHIAKDGNGNVISTTTFGSVTLRGILKKDADGNLYYDGDTYEWDGTVNRRFAEVDLGDLTWNLSNDFFYAQLGTKAHGNFNLVCAKYVTTTATSVSDMADKEIKGGSSNSYLYIKDSAYTTAAAFQTAMSGVYLVYELIESAQTTESADPFAELQVVDPDGTEEWTDYGVSQGTRDYAVPVGHESTYAMAYPISGTDSFTITANDGTAHTYPVSIGTTIYKGQVDVLDETYVSEMTNIASYNGETIGEPWLSSLDEYSPGTTPTTGAQVVYTSTPTEGSVTVTGDPTELGAVTSVTSTKGTVKWGNMMPLGLKAELTLDSPF